MTLQQLAAIAWRDMKGGWRAMTVLIVSLSLGVWMIASVGLISSAITAGISDNARSLLGGDVEVRTVHRPLPPEMISALDGYGRVTESRELRTMASFSDQFLLTELKAVDGAYPLYGTLELTPPGDDPLAFRDGHHGVVVEETVLARLGVAIGDLVTLGNTQMRIAAVIKREPDRAIGQFTLGPRILTSLAGLEATGLVMPGSMVQYHYGIRTERDADSVIAELRERYPDTGWELKHYHDAAGGLKRVLDRLQLFLSLAGLTALLIGGLGISHATLYYLQRKQRSIAVMKCSGAAQSQVLGLYALQLTMMTAGTIFIAISFAVGLEYALLHWLGDRLPITAPFGLYAKPLIGAAILGFLSVGLFAGPLLQQTATIKPAELLRARTTMTFAVPREPLSWLLYGTLLALIFATAVWLTGNWRFTGYFALGTAGSFLLLGACGEAIKRGLRRIGNRRVAWRLALINLSRKGAPTTGMVVAMGIGLSLLVGLMLVSRTIETQLSTGLPQDVPAFFLVDIQPDQLAPLQALLAKTPGTGTLDVTPMIRGRVSRINGVDAEKADIDEDVRWTVRNERGVTFAAAPPANADLVAGKWWDKTYRGEPLLSFDAAVAKGYGIGIGDTVTVTVLGQDIIGRIANLRDINWTSFKMNFVFVFSPTPQLEALPYMLLGTLQSDPDAELPIIRVIGREFPNISIVRVRDTIAQLNGMLDSVNLMITVAGSMTLLIGLMVVAGAIATTTERRMTDNVILRVLGASRRDLARIYGLEFGLLGVVTALLSLAIGAGIGAGVMRLMQFFQFHLLPSVMLGTAAGGYVLILLTGMAMTRRTLHARPMTILRNE